MQFAKVREVSAKRSLRLGLNLEEHTGTEGPGLASLRKHPAEFARVTPLSAAV
jgi:hypothetical protein